MPTAHRAYTAFTARLLLLADSLQRIVEVAKKVSDALRIGAEIVGAVPGR